MRYHADDRREFWGDIFDTPGGDVNIVRLGRNHDPIAWHRHQRQTDHIFLVNGCAGIRTRQSADDIQKVYILHEDHGRGPIAIPAGLWHGYGAYLPNTVLLQFNGPGKWDGTDEERHPIDEEMPWDD